MRLRRLWPAALVVVALAYYACYAARLPFVVTDEGYLLYIADAVNRGRVPYRDIELNLYPPELFHFFALVLRASGRSIIAARLAMAGFLALNVVLVAAIVRRLAGPRWALLAAGVVAVVPGPWHKFFVAHFYLLVLLAALWTLEAPAPRRFALLGAAVGSCLYFRLDAFAVGLAVAAAAAFAPPLVARAVRQRLSFLVAGLAAASAPLVAHLWHLGLLPEFARQLAAFAELAAGRTAAWYRLAPPPLEALGQASSTGLFAWLFYGSLLVPAWLLAGYVLRLMPGDHGRDRFDPLSRPVHLVLLIWLLGNVPQYAVERPDVSHLAQRMPALVVAGVVLAAAAARGRTGEPLKRRRLVPAGFLLAYLFAYVGFALHHGHGGSLTAALGRIETVTLSNGQRFEQAAGSPWGDIAEHLLTHTGPGEVVASLPYLPGLNFLTERPLPTRHVDLLPPSVERAGTEQVYIDALERAAVRYAVVDEGLRFSDRPDTVIPRYAPRLAAYLARRYAAERRYGSVTVLRRIR